MSTKKDIYGLHEMSVAQLHFRSGKNVSYNILFPENINSYLLSVNSYFCISCQHCKIIK